MASDNFTDDDETPLATHDANWTSIDATYTVENYEIINNLCQATGAWADAGAYYSGSSEDTSQVVDKPHTATKRCIVRVGTDELGYGIYFGSPDSGNWTRCYFSKSGAYLSSENVGTWSQASDHTFKIVASGTTTVTLTGYIDGSEEGSQSDSSSPLGSGSPGFYHDAAGNLDDLRWDDWTDLAEAPPTGIPIPIIMNYYRQLRN